MTSGAKSLKKVFGGPTSRKTKTQKTGVESLPVSSQEHPLLVWATDIVRDHPQAAADLTKCAEAFKKASAMT